MELNLARFFKDCNKGFSIGNKRKAKENMGILLNDRITQDMEKAEVLNALLISVFTIKTSLQEFLVPDSREGNLEQGICTLGGRLSDQGILRQIGHT